MTDEDLKALLKSRHELTPGEQADIIDAALSARAELAALRESEALLDGHCNAHIAERDEAVAELELWRSTKTGRHENEARKQLGQVYRHKLDAGPYQEIGVVEVNAAQKALSDALADGDNVRRLLTALETELETARAEQARLVERGYVGAREARAVAIEEVASELNRRYRINPATAMLGFYDWLRALAPLDPALCVVERETVEQARKSLSVLVATYDETEWTHEAAYYGFLKGMSATWDEARAALKALEEGR